MLTMPIYLLGGSCYQDMILILSDDTKYYCQAPDPDPEQHTTQNLIGREDYGHESC